MFLQGPEICKTRGQSTIALKEAGAWEFLAQEELKLSLWLLAPRACFLSLATCSCHAVSPAMAHMHCFPLPALGDAELSKVRVFFLSGSWTPVTKTVHI